MQRALNIQTEFDRFPLWLARILDALFVALIKFQPAWGKEQAGAINRLKNILNINDDSDDKDENYIVLGEKTYRVVDEFDDLEMYKK